MLQSRRSGLSLGLIFLMILMILLWCMKKFLIFSMIISACVITALFNITTPSSAGPPGVLAVFIFAYILFIGVTTFIIYWGAQLLVRISRAIKTSRPFEPMPFKRACYFSTIIALAPIMLIGLQSVGAVSLYSVILIILFVAIGSLYISKTV